MDIQARHLACKIRDAQCHHTHVNITCARAQGGRRRDIARHTIIRLISERSERRGLTRPLALAPTARAVKQFANDAALAGGRAGERTEAI